MAKPRKKTYVITGAHTSGRYDRRLHSLLTGVRALLDRRWISFVSGTEAKGRPTGFLDKFADEWDYAHGVETPEDVLVARGTKECWLIWKKSVWGRVGRVRAVVLSDSQYHTVRGGLMPKFRALRVKLQHIESGTLFIFYIVHMPLDNTELRSSVWFECCDGLDTLIENDRERYPDAKIVIQGDINKNFRQDFERAQMEADIARPTGTVQAWRHHIPATGGTHGPLGLIDGTFVDESVDVRSVDLLPDDPSSDHRPYRVRLAFEA